MTAFTAVASGDWDDPATWDVGVSYPLAGTDTATIGVFTVTIPLAASITCGAITTTGTSISNRSILTLNGSLTLAGTWTRNDWDTFNIGAGAVFDRNSQTIDYPNSASQKHINNFIGTSGNRWLYKNTGGAGQEGRTTLSSGVAIDMTWQFGDFVDAVNINVGSNYFAGDNVLIEDVAITDCNGMIIGTWREPSNDYIVRRCDVFGASTASAKIITFYPKLTTGTTATGTTDVSSIVFHGTSGTANSTTNIIRSQGQLLEFTNCIFSNVFHERVLNGPQKVISSLFTSDIIDTLGNNSGLDEVNDCYVLGYNHTSNAACNTINGGVIESNYIGGYVDDADHVIIGNSDMTVTNLLIIEEYSGVLLNALGSAKTGNYTVNHCTVVGNYDSAYGAIARTETGGSYAGTLVVQSNIVYDKSANAGSLGFNMDAGTPPDDMVTTMDYNNWHQIEDPYHGVTSATKTPGVTVGYGGNDTTLNPNFFDINRNIAAWDLSQGTGTGTEAAALTELRKLNGYNVASKTQVVAEKTSHTPADIVAWVRTGFAPTNILLQNAGHDSVTIGAVEYTTAYTATLHQTTNYQGMNRMNGGMRS